jgi:hypothetical protein
VFFVTIHLPLRNSSVHRSTLAVPEIYARGMYDSVRYKRRALHILCEFGCDPCLQVSCDSGRDSGCDSGCDSGSRPSNPLTWASTWADLATTFRGMLPTGACLLAGVVVVIRFIPRGGSGAFVLGGWRPEWGARKHSALRASEIETSEPRGQCVGVLRPARKEVLLDRSSVG